MPSDSEYDLIAPGYYDELYHKRGGSQSAWHHLKFRHVAAQVPEGARLLDVGCGPGTFLGNYPVGAEGVGVDVAAAQILYATERYGRPDQAPRRRFVVAGGGRLPFADGAFTALTSIEVVEHLHRPDELLDECRRLLAPGGRIVLTTPNYASHWPVLEWLVSMRTEVDYRHQHVTRFKRASLLALLERTGFTDVRVSSFLRVAPFVAGVSWRLAQRLDRFETRACPLPGALLLATARRA